MFVSRSKYADLQGRYEHAIAKREEAEKLAAGRLSVIKRQAEQLSSLHDQNPDTPLPEPQFPQGDPELRRQLHLSRRACASLDEQIRSLQAANEAMAAELRDLHKGSEAPA